jgi:peptidoglycan/xylan/chitin deacetylase (PgdA/CDA1 family)
MNKKSVPVLQYHHINWNKRDKNTLTPKEFEREMRYLSKKRYSSLFLEDLVNYLERGGDLPPQPIAITFDDGFKDNFIYAYPILKRYNLKATIFVVTSAIKERSTSSTFRNHFESLAGTVLSPKGSDDFLSWDQIKEMEESGLIDIQSHTHSHNRYYISEEIVGYNEGRYWWLGWSTDGDTRLGIPLYKSAPALVARRYYDDLSLREKLASFVARQGGKDFFRRRTLRKELNKVVEKYKSKNGLKDHYENPTEKEERIKKELSLSKRIIEEKLNKECKFLAWPWGKYNKESIDIARKCGYIGAVTTDEKGVNIPGSPTMSIKRIGACVGNRLFFPLKIKL